MKTFRRRWSPSALLGLAALALALLISARSSACGCDEPVAIAQADAAVLAKIKGVQRWSSRRRFEMTLEVERVFKGNVAATETVAFSENGPCSVGHASTFVTGARLVLYLQRSGHTYWIPECWRLPDANDVAALEALMAPDPKEPRSVVPAPHQQVAAAPFATGSAGTAATSLPRSRAAGCAGCSMRSSEGSPAFSATIALLVFAIRRRWPAGPASRTSDHGRSS